MEKMVCTVCGYVYDPEVGVPEQGIAPGTKFEDLPRILSAPSAASARICLRPPNKRPSCPKGPFL